MSTADKMWDAITTVIKMNDKVERMAGTMKMQQEKIEHLTERLVRLETMLEMALPGAKSKTVKPGQLEDKT